MNQTDKKAILDLALGKFSERDFHDLFSIPNNKYPEFIRDTLLDSLNKKDSDDVEYALQLMFQFELYNETLNEVICKLLVEDWHFKHEDLVVKVEKHPIRGCEENLWTLAQMQLPYLDYDEFFGLARKCTWALSRINIPASIEKLRLLANYENKIIAAYAQKRLVG